MKALSEDQQDLLRRALDNFGDHGIPADVTLTGSGASARDQEAVRQRIKEMSAGVRR